MLYDRGIGAHLVRANHIALVVSDIGKTLAFYTDVLGLNQSFRPDFDRHGAWLTIGNVDIHLIKGRPAVHPPDDLIVGHIAIEVDNMSIVREKVAEMNVPYRKNITVPNPGMGDDGVVDQIFLRDPDGYYIEICNCRSLHEYAEKIEAEKSHLINHMVDLKKSLQLSQKLKETAALSKEKIKGRHSKIMTIEDISPDFVPECPVDDDKLKNLLKRRKVYGDIVQPYDEEELRKLLSFTKNNVPRLIEILQERRSRAGKQLFVPPAFFEVDGVFHQPPSFEMPINN